MRVIAGTYRGRRLFAPRGHATRPTADRVREALFSILFDVSGWRVLDLFCGTGAVGIEALSRGAVHATFVERGKAALDLLRRNLGALGIDENEATVLTLPVDRALAHLSREGQRFDLVFADPPYDEAETLLPPILARVSELLSDQGKVVLELRSRHAPPTPGPELSLDDVRRYGEAELAFYERRIGK